MAVLAREVLRDTARALDARGIPLMPLKGALFQLILYDDPAERAISDVDVLVPERDFDAAIAALSAESFRVTKAGRSLIEVTLRSPRGLSLDLHRRLFSRARYRLDTEGVFQRATRDERLLGAPVYLADPYDTAAHLIGKFVSDHVVDERRPRLEELLRWVARSGIEPERLALHLDAHGLARAARLVLACGFDLLGAPFFAASLAALPCDPLGFACARLAGELIPRWQGRWFAAAPAHLLNASIARAGASAAWAVVNRWRHARWRPPQYPAA